MNLKLQGEKDMKYEFKPEHIVDKHPQRTIDANDPLLEKINLEQLLTKAKSKNKRAIGEICRRFDGMIVNLAVSFYIEGYTIEDVIQEGRLSLIKAIYKYDMKSKYHFPAYAAAAIKKNFYSRIRGSVKKYGSCSLYSVNDMGGQLIDMIESEEDIEEEFIKRQQSTKLWRALGKLSKKERYIIIWYYIWERGLKEYAAKQNMSYRTAAVRKKRALDHLRNIMDSP
jgi:RNA polymerase sigma factor (sigma-70 family)